MLRKIFSLRSIAAPTLAIALTAPSIAASVTYSVSGTFADGGTFSGTFGYDPVNNTFAVPNQYTGNPYAGPSAGEFDITTTIGTQLSGRQYQPEFGTNSGYQDIYSSTPNELYIDGCCQVGITTLALDWNTPLNAPGGGAPQPIVDGSEAYQQSLGGGPPEVIRQVTGGTVELNTPPVPLPSAVWLMLSGFVGLATLLGPHKSTRTLTAGKP